MPHSPFWIALIGGGITALATATVAYTLPSTAMTLNEKGYIAGAAGAASFITTLGLESFISNQRRRSIHDLQTQMNALCEGQFPVCATVYSEDEFGLLAQQFNQMAVVVEAIARDTDRQIQASEESNENIARQVVDLDDVIQRWASFDFTVSAEAQLPKELGVVAYCFNMIAQNLQQRMLPVKTTAETVAQQATDSEKFATFFASYPLLKPEDLAAALNILAQINQPIQQVTAKTQQAEELARNSLSSAIKGSEAVEQGVAKMIQMREFIGETPLKVQRIGNPLPEISKQIAEMAAIASRLNAIAMNARVTAATTGKTGKGIRRIANELDRLSHNLSASLIEMEEIGTQMQGEIASVVSTMAAESEQMQEYTNLAEAAKRSLEETIAVNNQCEMAVQDITAETVKLDETARQLTQSIQTVELTPQQTSPEAAQEMSGNLLNIIPVGQELLTCVERFRLETPQG